MSWTKRMAVTSKIKYWQVRSLLPMLFCFCIACIGQGLTCGAAPLVVTDDLGRQILLKCSPQRVVSLEPSVTEILYAVGAGNKIVADDYYADYPSAAKQKVHVNGIGPSREVMLGLHPDLIILFDQTFTRQKADDWQAAYQCPVYVTNAGTYVGVERDIDRLGLLVGNRAETTKTVASMEAVRVAVRRAVAGRQTPKVFVEVWSHPLMTAGKGAFITDLIEIAGGVNVAAANVSGYPTYSPEQLVADDPDFIFTGVRGSSTVKTIDNDLTAYNLRAVRNGKCYGLPDDWTVRPGPRLAMGLSAIARLLHPESFGK